MSRAQIRKAEFEWKVLEFAVDKVITTIQSGTRPEEAKYLPEDLKLIHAGVRDAPPPGSGYRYVFAVYETDKR